MGPPTDNAPPTDSALPRIPHSPFHTPHLLPPTPHLPPLAPSPALAFYQQNRAAMDAGASLLWPEEEDLHALMCMRAESGSAAFEREKQCVPAGIYIAGVTPEPPPPPAPPKQSSAD